MSNQDEKTTTNKPAEKSKSSTEEKVILPTPDEKKQLLEELAKMPYKEKNALTPKRLGKLKLVLTRDEFRDYILTNNASLALSRQAAKVKTEQKKLDAMVDIDAPEPTNVQIVAPKED